jgi:hypothetical protein
MAIAFEQIKANLFWLTVNESEWHQHPKGGGWVQNTAHVDESAMVEGVVFGDAQVFGDAWVFGNARVYGDAQVYGDDWAFSPLQIQGACHFVTTCTHTHLQIGCYRHTLIEWQRHYQRIWRSEGYTPDQIAECGLIIAFAADWLEAKFYKQGASQRDARGRFTKKTT